MPEDKLPPIHPGEILYEEFLKPMGITQDHLAEDLSVEPQEISGIIENKRPISADAALRLSRYFGMSEQFWLNLQTHYDLEIQKDRLGERLRREVKVRPVEQLPSVFSQPDRPGAAL
jgi:addiction module HigA family antidote